jgi:hypothetical protein
MIASGPPQLVLERYAEVTSRETRLLTPSVEMQQHTPAGIPLDLHRNRFGSLEATIDAVHIRDRRNKECTVLESGASLLLEVLTSMPGHMKSVNLAVKLIRRRDGLVCLDTSTPASVISGSVKFTAEFERLDLAAGDYSFDLGLYSDDWDRTFDFHTAAYELRVTSRWSADAVLAPPVWWTVQELPPRTLA